MTFGIVRFNCITNLTNFFFFGPSIFRKANYQFLPETATTDELRLKSRKLILDALMERNEDAPSTKIAKNIAARVEETIFQVNWRDTD